MADTPVVLRIQKIESRDIGKQPAAGLELARERGKHLFVGLDVLEHVDRIDGVEARLGHGIEALERVDAGLTNRTTQFNVRLDRSDVQAAVGQGEREAAVARAEVEEGDVGTRALGVGLATGERFEVEAELREDEQYFGDEDAALLNLRYAF